MNSFDYVTQEVFCVFFCQKTMNPKRKRESYRIIITFPPLPSHNYSQWFSSKRETRRTNDYPSITRTSPLRGWEYPRHHPRAAGGWWWHEWNYRRMMVLTLNKNHASDLPSVSCTFPTTACYPTIIPASMDRASQHHHPPIRLLFRETMVGSWWCWSKRRRPPMLSKERWDVVVVDNGASWRWLSPWKTM